MVLLTSVNPYTMEREEMAGEENEEGKDEKECENNNDDILHIIEIPMR
jgi:hypothetical protein